MEEVADGMIAVCASGSAFLDAAEDQGFPGVGSHQVPFPMCTLETLQKYCSTSSLLLTFC